MYRSRLLNLPVATNAARSIRTEALQRSKPRIAPRTNAGPPAGRNSSAGPLCRAEFQRIEIEPLPFHLQPPRPEIDGFPFRSKPKQTMRPADQITFHLGVRIGTRWRISVKRRRIVSFKHDEQLLETRRVHGIHLQALP